MLIFRDKFIYPNVVNENPTELNVFDIQFNVMTPKFLKEAAENCNGGMYTVCWNIFKNLLAMVAKRATEINDPIMNVLMLRLGLYDVKPQEVAGYIEKIKKELEQETLKK